MTQPLPWSIYSPRTRLRRLSMSELMMSPRSSAMSLPTWPHNWVRPTLMLPMPTRARQAVQQRAPARKRLGAGLPTYREGYGTQYAV